MDWLWLAGALFLGGSLLLAATTVDRRHRRRLDAERVVVRRRGVAEVDRHVPSYVTQAAIDDLPGPEGADAQGTRFDARLAHDDLLPPQGKAVVDGPRVLVVEGALTTMRQLLAVLADHEPLLVVAERLDEQLARTLAANRRQLHLPVLACAANPGDLLRIAQHVGAEPLTADDLRAGYVPAGALGRAERATADRRHLWLVA